MKKILIITNSSKDPEGKYTSQLCEKIEQRGGCAVRLSELAVNAEGNYILDDGYGCCMVLGGDGTMLRAARDTMGSNIPLLGINLGTLGFLADVEMDKVDDALDRVFTDDYVIQNRLMISGKLHNKTGDIDLKPALNDITVTRKGSLHIIRFKISVNGQHLCLLNADGVIISTPTGSTGYNMSAGGPIVQPGTELMVITPICAHGNNMRPIVIGAQDTVEIEIDKSGDGNDIPAEVSVDGADRYDVATGDHIIIGRSEYRTKLMRMTKSSFLETLNRKMGSQVM